MLTKPDGCNSCPLKDKGKGFVPDLTYPNSKYIIFGEAPGKNEIEEGKPFVGKAGFVLKNWLLRVVPQLQLAEEKKKVSYMNILKCLPPETQGRPYPRGKEKEEAEACCAQYMKLPASPVVILCGESPQRFFFKDELEAEDASDKRLGRDVKGVTGRIGRTYEKDGRLWVFAPHPAFILKQPALVQHGQAALRIATGEDKVMEPELVKWDQAVEVLIDNRI